MRRAAGVHVTSCILDLACVAVVDEQPMAVARSAIDVARRGSGNGVFARGVRPELPVLVAQMMKNSPASKSDLNNDQRVSHQTGTTIGN